MFLTRFLYREVTSLQPAWALKTRFEGQSFLFCAKVHLEHYGITWSILYRTSTENHMRIRANPKEVALVHFSGYLCTTPGQAKINKAAWCGRGRNPLAARYLRVVYKVLSYYGHWYLSNRRNMQQYIIAVLQVASCLYLHRTRTTCR